MKNVYSFISSIALGIGVLSCVISFSDSVPFKVACAFLCLFFSICYFAIDIKAFGKFYKSIVGLVFLVLYDLYAILVSLLMLLYLSGLEPVLNVLLILNIILLVIVFLIAALFDGGLMMDNGNYNVLTSISQNTNFLFCTIFIITLIIVPIFRIIYSFCHMEVKSYDKIDKDFTIPDEFFDSPDKSILPSTEELKAIGINTDNMSTKESTSDTPNNETDDNKNIETVEKKKKTADK